MLSIVTTLLLGWLIALEQHETTKFYSTKNTIGQPQAIWIGEQMRHLT